MLIFHLMSAVLPVPPRYYLKRVRFGSSKIGPGPARAQPYIGLTDGAVMIFEPLKSEEKWGVPPPVDNGLHTTNEGSLGIGSKRWVQEANVSF
ncbi:hypothetical protein ACFX1X_044173 [Malus domestica]